MFAVRRDTHAGTIEKTILRNCSVVNLNVNAEAKLTNAGAVVGVINASAEVNNITITNSTVYATTNAGGIAGTNNGRITNINADVDVNYNATTANAQVGGVAANNSGTIDNVKLTTNITTPIKIIKPANINLKILECIFNEKIHARPATTDAGNPTNNITL